MDAAVMNKQSVYCVYRCRKILILLAVLALPASGCVERRYTIRTNPPGALAYINGEEIGTTPVSRSFTYYGDREITLVHDGFETQRVIQPINAPWWDNLFTEFFSENLIPWTIRDERELNFEMLPTQNGDINELENRGNLMRAASQAGPEMDEPQRGLFRWLRR
jgi:hypothetical protein